MYKIKLLILLPISIFFLSCSYQPQTYNSSKYSLSYIGGGYDGLLLKNIFAANLKSINQYDQNSIKKINANIEHDTDIFITNIDNTSDRSKITSSLSVKIYNQEQECFLFNDEFIVSQFYIYAPGDKFLSNQTAVKKIKSENTESLVKKAIISINNNSLGCKYEYQSS